MARLRTLLDTFLSSYVDTLTAVIEKVKKDKLGDDTIRLYLDAKQLGLEALQTLGRQIWYVGVPTKRIE